MIRILRKELDAAIAAVAACAGVAENVAGQKIIFSLDRSQIEHLICGALSIVAPGGGPVTPCDVVYVTGFGTDDFYLFPKSKLEIEHARKS